jgi:UDP-2-acetamido-2-deoxy-ribo-hexuluronate aminotransferase
MIPFANLKAQYGALKPQIRERIDRVLEHGQYIMGPEVAELETKLAQYTGARHCITVASGTEALLIGLMALGVKPGDEVITTPFTFVATAEVIVLLGATPVFVDVESDTCNIDVTKLEAKISPRTRAIMPVSLYGQIADMDEINEIARRRGNIAVIEDGAQSFGATYKKSLSCNLSALGCTSFFPSKPLGCYGDGGAIFTSDDALAQACREIRVHGQSRRYVHTRVGVGGRMDTLQCAIVLAKLERFDWELKERSRIARRYTHLLSELGAGGAIDLPVEKTDRVSAWAQYTLRARDREALQARLKEAGVPTAVHYPVPLDQQPAYEHLARAGSTPVSTRLSREVISLPMSADLSAADQDLVINAVRTALLK